VPGRRLLHAGSAPFSKRHGGVGWFLQVSVPYHRKPRLPDQQNNSMENAPLCLQRHHLLYAPSIENQLMGRLHPCPGGMGYGLYAGYHTFRYHDTVPGWTTEIIFTSVLGGAILVSNGILGEYIGRSFEELKGRPLYVVATALILKNSPALPPFDNHGIHSPCLPGLVLIRPKVAAMREVFSSKITA